MNRDPTIQDRNIESPKKNFDFSKKIPNVRSQDERPKGGHL